LGATQKSNSRARLSKANKKTMIKYILSSKIFKVVDPSLILFVGGYFYFFIKQLIIFLKKKFLLIINEVKQ
jgi:hypothetical protein